MVALIEAPYRDSVESLTPAEPDAMDRARRAARTERLASIGTMAAGIAHEINNPLMYVLANTSFGLETLDRHVDSLRRIEEHGAPGIGATLAELAELRTALLEATEGVERVRTIVADLRRFARAEGVETTGLEVSEVVVRAARMSAGVVAPRARLETELGPTPVVRANEGLLVQVLTNVLVNAAEAMGTGGTPGAILLRTLTSRRGEAVIEVLDDGPGFTPEALERLFDPFFTTKPVGAGTGLGLSISHGAVRAMGGRITADNRPGGGAIVRIVLPPAPSEAMTTTSPALARRPEAGPTRAGPTRTGPTQTGPTQTGPTQTGPTQTGQIEKCPTPGSPRRPRVLVVDDDPIVGRSIVRLLRTTADATSVTSGREAEALLSEGRDYDVILCDFMMPEISGADVHAWIASHRPDLSRRIVFLSGGATTEEARQFLERCETPLLTKPVPAQVLRDLVTGREAAA